jgi:DNA repair protein SbcD/Mre11
MNFTFVHAADLHLDTPFEGLGRVNDTLAARLRDASLDAWDRLVALTLERGAAFLLLAGDIYDGAERGLRAQLRFRAGLERLSAAGVPVFIVHGNHDPVDGWSAIRDWPPGVTVFGAAAVRAVPVERDGARIATIYGISHATRQVSENLALRYRAAAAPGLHIGLLHATVTAAASAADHAPYSPCTLDDLAAAGMDYWALGHIHAAATVRAGGPWVAYPGSVQGRSMKPSERGAKGALVVRVEDGAVRRLDFVACDRVRFAELEVDIEPVPDVAALADAVVEALLRHAGGADGREVVARVRLTGRAPLSGELRRTGVLGGLLTGVREAVAASGGRAWCDRIENATRTPLDLDRIRARGDLPAAVLGRADGLAASAAERTAFMAEHLAPLVAAGLMPTDADALLDESVALALGMLEDGAST